MNMTGGNISQEFRLKEVDEKRNYFIEEVKQNKLISKKHKKIFRTLNQTDHLFILVSTVTGCVSVSPCTSLVSIPVGTANSATTMRVCTITAGIKKTIINKEKKKHDETVLLAKTKLNTVKASIWKLLIDSNIHHDEFLSVNNALKECDNKKEKNQKLY